MSSGVGVGTTMRGTRVFSSATGTEPPTATTTKVFVYSDLRRNHEKSFIPKQKPHSRHPEWKLARQCEVRACFLPQQELYLRPFQRSGFSFVPIKGEIMKNPLFQNTNSRYVNRGGGWYSNAGYTRVSRRSGNDASFRFGRLGFRLFRSSEKS